MPNGPKVVIPIGILGDIPALIDQINKQTAAAAAAAKPVKIKQTLDPISDAEIQSNVARNFNRAAAAARRVAIKEQAFATLPPDIAALAYPTTAARQASAGAAARREYAVTQSSGASRGHAFMVDDEYAEAHATRRAAQRFGDSRGHGFSVDDEYAEAHAARRAGQRFGDSRGHGFSIDDEYAEAHAQADAMRHKQMAAGDALANNSFTRAKSIASASDERRTAKYASQADDAYQKIVNEADESKGAGVRGLRALLRGSAIVLGTEIATSGINAARRAMYTTQFQRQYEFAGSGGSDTTISGQMGSMAGQRQFLSTMGGIPIVGQISQFADAVAGWSMSLEKASDSLAAAGSQRKELFESGAALGQRRAMEVGNPAEALKIRQDREARVAEFSVTKAQREWREYNKRDPNNEDRKQLDLFRGNLQEASQQREDLLAQHADEQKHFKQTFPAEMFAQKAGGMAAMERSAALQYEMNSDSISGFKSNRAADLIEMTARHKSEKAGVEGPMLDAILERQRGERNLFNSDTQMQIRQYVASMPAAQVAGGAEIAGVSGYASAMRENETSMGSGVDGKMGDILSVLNNMFQFLTKDPRVIGTN